jgi:hypothetical protein
MTMLIAHQSEAIFIYLFNQNASDKLLYFKLALISWAIRNILYYYLLIKQSQYLMGDRLKFWLFMTLGVFAILVVITMLIGLLYAFNILPYNYVIIAQYIDLTLLIQLTTLEFVLNYLTYKNSKLKLKTLNYSLWTRVKYSIYILNFCLIIDILILLIENFNNSNLAYSVKTCSYAFKVVFELLCFQFVKGIVVNIDQYYGIN